MGTRALPSILSKGFFSFLSFSQSRNVKAVLSVQSVVKEKCSLRGHIHQFGVNCPLAYALPYGITLVFSVKRRVLPTLPFRFVSFL